MRGCAEAAQRLEELCAREPSVCEPADPLPLPACQQLALEHVWSRYGEQAPWLIEDASLRLRAGEHVALLGPSGTGKTTLAQLLVRFRDPTRGRITIDGIDLRLLAQDDVRRAVLLGAQDAQVFNTTIRQNLLLARPAANADELWAALEAAGAADFVRDLPQGLDTFAGQDGDLLSGGQRQRIALARALLADAPFLVLDEPTVHLDPDTARAVMSALPAHAGDRGLLVITHDATGLESFDAVYELREGALDQT
jgi:ABC-type bacteriocin/lantibiotic exporter with double-glycine peptidase domain